MRDLLPVCCYVGAGAAANLAVWLGGPAVLPLTAFALVPFDLAARDALHERWRGPRLWPRMAALVAGGAALSAVACPGSWRVAVASFLSFSAAGAADALVYALMHRKPYLFRANASNVASAVIDSVAFPLVAFGLLDARLSLSQAFLKSAGGAVWAWLLASWAARAARNRG